MMVVYIAAVFLFVGAVAQAMCRLGRQADRESERLTRNSLNRLHK